MGTRRCGRTAVSLLAAVLCPAMLLGGCGHDQSPASPPPSTSPSATPLSSVRNARWAVPVRTSGTWLGALGDSRVRIDVFQAGTATSPRASVMVDPRTSEPIIKKGDTLVGLRYVVTNVSDDPIRLGLGTVTMSTRYPDWSWSQDLLAMRDQKLEEKLGCPAVPFTRHPGPAPYVLAPGESFMMGHLVPFESAEKLQIKGKVTVVDESGAPDPGLGWTVSGDVHLP